VRVLKAVEIFADVSNFKQSVIDTFFSFLIFFSVKAVEIFADDSNFKQSVIDTSASAIARYEEFE
jgi:hypothetical protein